MRNPHFLLDKPDKLIFHNNLDIFFYVYLYIHVGNTMFIDNMPYKSMFNGPYSAIFLESFDGHCGEYEYLLGTILLYLENSHMSKYVVPTLNTIPLVGLDVLIEMIQDFFKCYFKNAVGPTNPLFVIVRN